MDSRKFGAPPKRQPKVGERFQLGIRVTSELKSRLDAAAERSGRSQSQEAELRLEHSFNREELLVDVLTMAYSRQTAGLLMLLGAVMEQVGRDCQLERDYLAPVEPGQWRHWTSDPEAFDQVVRAASMLLNAVRPAGEPKPNAATANIGASTAHRLMEVIASRPEPTANTYTLPRDRVEMIHGLLGPIADRMVHPREPNPFRLALAVVIAAGEVERFGKTQTGIPLPTQPVVEILEGHLKDYLLDDWQHRGPRDEGQHHEAGQEELADQIRRRA